MLAGVINVYGVHVDLALTAVRYTLRKLERKYREHIQSIAAKREQQTNLLQEHQSQQQKQQQLVESQKEILSVSKRPNSSSIFEAVSKMLYTYLGFDVKALVGEEENEVMEANGFMENGKTDSYTHLVWYWSYCTKNIPKRETLNTPQTFLNV